jgi:TolB-like protein/tetratricopeptide (TPR) repeat protein
MIWSVTVRTVTFFEMISGPDKFPVISIRFWGPKKMLENAKARPITIDLNQFKLHIALKNRIELTLHFNSPSRRFYLSVIALVVNEMKRQGKMKSIPLEGHHDLLALLNETIGGSAGSSEEEHLLPRIYKKWQHALPNLEEAPLFMVLGRKKGYEEGIGKTYPFTEAEKDNWANLFEYKGSHENVRLKFAIDKIGATLDDIAILYEDSLNGEAWDRFLSNLKGKIENAPEIEAIQSPSEVPESPMAPVGKQKVTWQDCRRWIALIAMIVVFAGATTLAIWKLYPKPAPVKRASLERMAFPLPDKPSIAVLPFVNLSKDPEQEFFSDGLTDDLITDLSKISGLLVIARNSTFTYKGKPVKVKQVAEELGVRYVLEGSVRRAGDEVRITAQLIDAVTGVHLWAERYDGPMNKVFALQDEITQKIVSAMQVQLSGGEKEQVGLKATDNIEAYNALLEGVGHFFRYTPDGTAKAAAFFKKAIELDPNYGRAYAALAHVYYQATLFTALLPALNMSWIEARLRLREYTQMALKKPTPSAYNLSALLYLSRRQHKEAISEEERGLALDPNSRECHFNMGRVLYLAGRPKEGIEYINKSWRLDPRSRLLNLVALGWAHFCMGETAEAATCMEQAQKLHPEAGLTIPLAAFYAALGRDQDARSMIEMLRKKQGAVLSVGGVLFGMPFRDRAIVDRYAEGLLKAGLAPAKVSGGYFPASKENQLTGEEIKSLLLGSRITGIDQDGQQWWVDRKKNGEFAWRGPALKDPYTQKIISAPTLAGPNSDRGKSRIEGDMICQQFQKSYWGLEFCGTVFRNPKGTNESKDEYFFCNDIGFTSFSLVP